MKTNSQITNPNISETDLNMAIKPQGINMLKVLYRSYPDAGIPESSLILTTNGFKPAGDIKITDLIISGAGRPARISAISKSPEQPVYQILLKSGRKLYASCEAAWGLSADSHDNIKYAITTKDMFERTLHREEIKTKSAMNLSIPICQPVSFSGEPEPDAPEKQYRRNLYKKEKHLFQTPMPEDYLFASIQGRREILKFFTRHSDESLTAYDIPINPKWHPELKHQILHIARSLGYNARFEYKPNDKTILRIFTAQNLQDLNKPPRRFPKPSDFRDDILEVRKLDTQEHMISIAPEAHVYNYIIQDFCVFHITLCSYEFESRQPRMPWGTTKDNQVPLRHLYLTNSAK